LQVEVTQVRELVSDLIRVGRFVPVSAYQAFGYACGGLLIASGLFHGVVYLVDGGAWQGPLSWRKPTVFGLSFGLTLATVTWLTAFLRPRRPVGWLLIGVLGIASIGEVFLISMQTWRGVASHFNESTNFDGAVFSTMGALVSIVGLVMVAITVWALLRLDAPPSLALAIRLGLVLTLVSQGVGVQMIVEGGNTFGGAGALKLPHAVTLHAVQVLPALALLLLTEVSPERRRVRIVLLGAFGYALLIASTMAQTYAGRAPLDLTLPSSGLAGIGLILLGICAALALLGLGSRANPPVSGPPSAPADPALQGGTP
jgi:hypothetical protein